MTDIDPSEIRYNRMGAETETNDLQQQQQVADQENVGLPNSRMNTATEFSEAKLLQLFVNRKRSNSQGNSVR